MSSPQSSDSSKSTHTEIALVNPSGPQSKNKKVMLKGTGLHVTGEVGNRVERKYQYRDIRHMQSAYCRYCQRINFKKEKNGDFKC